MTSYPSSHSLIHVAGGSGGGIGQITTRGRRVFPRRATTNGFVLRRTRRRDAVWVVVGNARGVGAAASVVRLARQAASSRATGVGIIVISVLKERP